jgi:hypothetical protein
MSTNALKTAAMGYDISHGIHVCSEINESVKMVGDSLIGPIYTRMCCHCLDLTLH